MLIKWMFLSCIRGPGVRVSSQPCPILTLRHAMISCTVVAYALLMHIYIEAWPFRKLGKFGSSCCATRKVSRRSQPTFAVNNIVYPNRAALNVQDIFMSMVDACLAAGDMKSLVEVFQELVDICIFTSIVPFLPWLKGYFTMQAGNGPSNESFMIKAACRPALTQNIFS